MSKPKDTSFKALVEALNAIVTAIEFHRDDEQKEGKKMVKGLKIAERLIVHIIAFKARHGAAGMAIEP